MMFVLQPLQRFWRSRRNREVSPTQGVEHGQHRSPCLSWQKRQSLHNVVSHQSPSVQKQTVESTWTPAQPPSHKAADIDGTQLLSDKVLDMPRELNQGRWGQRPEHLGGLEQDAGIVKPPIQRDVLCANAVDMMEPTHRHKQNVSALEHSFDSSTFQRTSFGKALEVGVFEIEPRLAIQGMVRWVGIHSRQQGPIEEQEPLRTPDLQEQVVLLVVVYGRHEIRETHEELVAGDRPETPELRQLLHHLVVHSMQVCFQPLVELRARNLVALVAKHGCL
mmetsp:Transcript_27044/g.89807  ORF Transcript_27044/g.89807 Transcript_27044/m.89807 type:complete len:277 (+) Transcript_27044:1346-2176(+)